MIKPATFLKSTNFKKEVKEMDSAVVVYLLTFLSIAAALVLIRHNFVNLRNHDEGEPLMVERAAIIREGAKTFLRSEDRAIAITVSLVALSYTLIHETWAGPAMLLGSILARAAVEIGMRGGTYANVRTANAAKETNALSRTIRIATLGGSLSGFTVPAFGLLGFVVVFLLSGGGKYEVVGHGLLRQAACNALAMRLTAYSLGCSLVAMFNRVAGGTYTKSADIAADNVGKRNHGLDEDDPRNVCSVADLIGDCVNDIAGNISDLLESLVATPLSCVLIATQAFADDRAMLVAACMYPFVLLSSGLFSTLVSIMFVILKNRKKFRWVEVDGERVKEEYSPEVDDPGAELSLAVWISAIIVVVAGLYGARAIFGEINLPESFRLGWLSPWVSSVSGIVSAVCVGRITEYYTSTQYRPVQRLSHAAIDGEAYVISEGIAIGCRSVLLPVIVIGFSMMLSGRICGTFGIAVAAVGMLSFVGTTVSIDAFGPIADNAGGIAEGCGLDENVRAITDKADATGNTTAAEGKGAAIGAAAFATVALIISYIGSYPTPDYTDPLTVISVVVGAIFGAAVIVYFIGILTGNTNRAAEKLTVEAERQLALPGIMEKTVQPDYNKAIELAAVNALHYMLVPSLISVASPIVLGMIFGPEMVLGLLGGSTAVAIVMAIYNGNAGGAYDNGKKSFEMGLVAGHGKGSPAHRAAIVGDTVGDIMKDVVAVCLDISIKTMSTVANSMAMVFYTYRMF